jgi:hypothetical protein
MSKKAAGIGTLAVVAVLFALLIFMVIFAIRVGTSTNKFVEDSECAKYIKAHAFLLKTSGEAVVSDIYCPTKYYTVSGKDDEVKYSLAEALKTCWGTWGKGQLNLFKDEGRYCNICSVVNFGKKDATITGFNDYLIKNQISTTNDMTYMEYLTGVGSENSDPQVLAKLESVRFTGSIDTSKSYAVMFVYVKGVGEIKKFFDSMDVLGFGTPGGGAVTGLIAGTIGTTAGAIFLASPPGWIVAGIMGIGVVGGAVAGIITADDVDWVSTVMFMEYSNQSLQKIGCQITPVKQDKTQGVSG